MREGRAIVRNYYPLPRLLPLAASSSSFSSSPTASPSQALPVVPAACDLSLPVPSSAALLEDVRAMKRLAWRTTGLLPPCRRFFRSRGLSSALALPSYAERSCFPLLSQCFCCCCWCGCYIRSPAPFSLLVFLPTFVYLRKVPPEGSRRQPRHTRNPRRCIPVVVSTCPLW